LKDRFLFLIIMKTESEVQITGICFPCHPIQSVDLTGCGGALVLGSPSSALLAVFAGLAIGTEMSGGIRNVRFSGSPTQLTKKVTHRLVRSKRWLDCAM
jgi:hypothetical protein